MVDSKGNPSHAYPLDSFNVLLSWKLLRGVEGKAFSL